MRLYLAHALLCAACVTAGCTPRVAAPVDAAAPADAGERIFNGSCVPCHQHNGQGIPGAYPSLAGSSLVLGPLQPLSAWVLEGQRPAAWPAERYSTVMPKFGWIKDDDAAALFTYLRSHFGNSAAPVTAAQVARAVGR